MMDRALKERIIGAVVLVIFVVLVVPIFLDGPANDAETVQQRVVLPGQGDQETKTVVLDRDRTNPSPVPVNTTAVEEQTEEPVADEAVAEEVATEDPVPEDTVANSDPEPETQAAQTTAQPAETKPAPPPEVPPSAATSSTGMWAVQLGSFSSRENADALAKKLRDQGYMAAVSQVATANGTMHRVRVGPQRNRDEAEHWVTRLAKVGYEGRVVPHP